MPSAFFANYKHELNVLSKCNSTVFKALVDSNKEIVECLLEILDNVGYIRIELDDDTLEKLSKKADFFEKILSTKSIQASKAILLENIKTTQIAIKAALPVIEDDQPV